MHIQPKKYDTYYPVSLGYLQGNYREWYRSGNGSGGWKLIEVEGEIVMNEIYKKSVFSQEKIVYVRKKQYLCSSK